MRSTAYYDDFLGMQPVKNSQNAFLKGCSAMREALPTVQLPRNSRGDSSAEQKRPTSILVGRLAMAARDRGSGTRFRRML